MLKTALVEAAWVSCRKKDSFLRHKYESLVGRRGKKRALIAVGHKILCAAFFILKDHLPYQEFDYQKVLESKKQKQIQRYKSKLLELGVAV